MHFINRSSKPFFILLLFTTGTLFSQRPQGTFDGLIRGRVLDADLNEPIEYANIVLYLQRDSTQVTGTITNREGNFQLTGIRPGSYYVEISFIGYHTDTIDDVEITPGTPEASVGDVYLQQTILGVQGTEVVADRPALAFQIDKKVINVSRQTTTTSGTAVDILENVPSVTVDIEGNVSLRGSENFTVLIDGRPTVLESNEALQQIPASTIESIEIITNPSAKYDPDGISGIINVIMKKKNLRGTSGIANLNLGLDEKYGGDFLLSYQRGIYNAYFGADYNKSVFPGTRKIENIMYHNDTVTYINSNGDFRWKRNPFGLRGGIDLDLGFHDKLSLGGRFGKREMQRILTFDYDEWSDQGDEHNVYTSNDEGKHSHVFYALSADYLHRFLKKNHEIAVRAFFSQRKGDEKSTNRLLDTTGMIISGQQNTEEGPTTLLRLKLDYTLPLREKDKFEAGFQSRINNSEDINKLYEYDTVTDTFEFTPQFSHTTKYTRDIQSLYAIYSGEWGHLGYQGGLRGEYTYRTIETVGEVNRFTIDRWDYFPTAHLSYKFQNGQHVMASYTRRIERPRYWWLEPFMTWFDAYNVRMGNPALKPEYVDSYELGYQTFLGRNLFSAEAYYRITHNKVERIRSAYIDNTILHTVENVGTDYALGTEFMLDLKLFKWWNINCLANFFDYRIEGDLNGEEFSERDFNWSTRFSNELRLLNSTTLQINGRYNSPAITAQGQREGFFMTDAALKQDFLRKKLSVTLQVRDIFGTSKREYRSEDKDFSSYSYSTRKSPIVMLNIRYNFNNYKQERQRDDNDQEFEGMEDL